MKLDELIAHHVAGTTLNSTCVKGFLSTPPHYYQWGIDHQIDQVSLNRLDATDLFEFHLRLYLTGRHKTLQAVVREVRAFAQQDANGAYYLISFSLEGVRQSLLNMEWYELILRLETARETILPLVPKLNYPLRPLLVSFLEESY